jgi:hypothetical protein
VDTVSLSSIAGNDSLDNFESSGRRLVFGKSHLPWSIQALYDMPLEGLDILGRTLDCKDITDLATRFRIWALGLFDGPLALCELIRSEDYDTIPYLDVALLRKCFIKVALNVGKLLSSLARFPSPQVEHYSCYLCSFAVLESLLAIHNVIKTRRRSGDPILQVTISSSLYALEVTKENKTILSS